MKLSYTMMNIKHSGIGGGREDKRRTGGDKSKLSSLLRLTCTILQRVYHHAENYTPNIVSTIHSIFNSKFGHILKISDG